MEILDSFLAQNGSTGFESFVPKARRILKLPGEPFGKSYAIALPLRGRAGEGGSPGRRRLWLTPLPTLLRSVDLPLKGEVKGENFDVRPDC